MQKWIYNCSIAPPPDFCPRRVISLLPSNEIFPFFFLLFFFPPILKGWPIIGRGEKFQRFRSSFEAWTKGKIDELFNLISLARSEFRTTLTRKRYFSRPPPPFYRFPPLSRSQLCATFRQRGTAGDYCAPILVADNTFVTLKESLSKLWKFLEISNILETWRIYPRGGTRIERVNPCCLEIFPIISPGSGEQGDVRINQKSIDQKFIFPWRKGRFSRSRLSPFSPLPLPGFRVRIYGRIFWSVGGRRKKETTRHDTTRIRNKA